VIDRIFKGENRSAVIKLLTERGFLCDANPTQGSWALAFGRMNLRSLFQETDENADSGGILIPSGQWLVQFKDYEEYQAYAGRVEAYMQGKAVDAILSALKAQTGAGEEITEPKIEDPKKMMEYLRELQKLLKEMGDNPDPDTLAQQRKELKEKYAAIMGQSSSIEAGRSMKDNITELELMGGANATIGLMEVYVNCRPTSRNAGLLHALANIDPANRADQLQADEFKDLRYRLGRICLSLGQATPYQEESAGTEKLIETITTVKTFILRKVALDSQAIVDHRAAALDSIRKFDPVLKPAGIVSITDDNTLTHLLRIRAIKLCHLRKLRASVPALQRILREISMDSVGPPPTSMYSSREVSGFSLKVEAIKALGEIGDPESIPVLTEILKTPSTPGCVIKDYAAAALAGLNATGAIPDIETALASDPQLDKYAKKDMQKSLARLKAAENKGK
ncbi:HEAT repeat domain-containing protein, partial [Planctomycetota bacterium]